MTGSNLEALKTFGDARQRSWSMNTQTNRRSRLTLSLAAWCSTAALACAGHVDDVDGEASWQESPSVGQAEEPLLNAREDTGSSLNAVVWLGTCTGTLVGERYVLTSGHCNNGPHEPAEVYGAWYPTSVPVTFGRDRTNPTFTARATAYNQAGYEDIILLRLDRRVPPEVALPIAPLTEVPGGESPVSWLTSRSFTLSGFGRIEGGELPRVRRWANATVAEFPYVSFGVLQPNMLRASGTDCATVQPGDSGSPLLWHSGSPSPRYRLAGVAQGVESCGGRYLVSFGNGGYDSEGNAKPDLGAWLRGAIPADFTFSGGVSFGCNGGTPVAHVRVRNQGLVKSSTWVDLFVGRTNAPPIGTLSSNYKRSKVLEPGEVQLLTFELDAGLQTERHWVDVLLDTTRSVAEENEGNNHLQHYGQILDCSFH